MRLWGLAALACAALAAGSASAAEPTATNLLTGSLWGWLGFEHDLSKITDAEIQEAGRRACSKPNIAFRGAGGQLVKLDYVVDPPSPTTYPKTQVLTRPEGTLITLFYSADGAKPDGVLKLSRGDTILSIPDKMFGVWHYVRCGPSATPRAPGGGR